MRLFGGVRLGQMGEQKELGMGKRRGGAGVKVWGPEQGRWKHFYAEEKLLMATPPPRPRSRARGREVGGVVLPTCSGAPVILGFYEWDGQRGEKD